MVTSTACPAAPAARSVSLRDLWAALWKRSERHASLGDLPDDLRADVGLDGGLPLARFENGGRVFIVNGRPNSALSSWHW